MKKILFAVMAVVAIGFASCGNKTQQAEAVDSAAIVDSLAGEAAQGVIDQLGAQLEAGDVSKLQEVLTTAKEKIADLIKENPEVAKEYVAKLQAYLKENAEKVTALVGENVAAGAALTALTEADPESIVTGVLGAVGETATEVKDAAVDAAASQVDAGKAAVDAAASQVDAAKAAAQQQVDAAKDAAKQQVEDTKAAAKQKAGEAVDNAAAAAKKQLGL